MVKILIVDDETSRSREICSAIYCDDIEIEEATTKTDALRKMTHTQYDLLILDICAQSTANRSLLKIIVLPISTNTPFFHFSLKKKKRFHVFSLPSLSSVLYLLHRPLKEAEPWTRKRNGFHRAVAFLQP